MILAVYGIIAPIGTACKLSLSQYTTTYKKIYMDAAAEIGRNPVSKHQIQPEYEDEQADPGRIMILNRDKINYGQVEHPCARGQNPPSRR